MRNTQNGKTWRKKIFLGLLLGISFFLTFRPPLDPDLGWHIRTGQYIWEQKQVPATDQFSHTFSEYPVIAHEWLTDVGLYGLSTLGWPAGWLIAAVFSTLAVAAFGLAARIVSAEARLQALAVLLGAAVSGPLLGVRPQVVSVFGLSLVVFMLYRFVTNEKSRALYLLPLVFLFWANLHGGFVLGLFAVGLVIVAELSRHALKRWYQSIGELVAKRTLSVRTLQPSRLIRLAAVGIVSAVMTLVNPYGLRLYHEIYNTFIQTVGTADVRNTISEWQSVSLQHIPGLELLLFGALLVLLMIRGWRKIDYTLAFIAVIFFFLALTSWRYLPLYMVVVTPFWVLLAQAWPSGAIDRLTKNIIVISIGVATLGLVAWSQGSTYWQSSASPKALAVKYPYEAVQYLKNHLPAGAMYNEYDWGGYLLWNLPGEKVFIDGRMAIWRQNGKNVYRDWQAITRLDENWRSLLDSYQVDWVILRHNHRLAELLRRDPAWREVYVDTMAAIIIRKTDRQ